MKILIIDFNEDYFPIYKRKLGGTSNLGLFFAKNYLEAIDVISSNSIDCIILNHLFYNTYGIYDRLRSAGFSGKIIISVAGKEKHVKRNKYNGIVGVIDKSLNGEDFKNCLFSLVDDTNKSNVQEVIGAI